jgi:activator of HSP90 ATPase
LAACFNGSSRRKISSEVAFNVNLIKPTRRQVAAGATLALVEMIAVRRTQTQEPATQAPRPNMAEKPSTSANQDRTSIHYELDFDASPQRLYSAIIDQKQFAAFTGLPAIIDPKEGGAFSMFGGLITGRNVELIEGSRIVQAWRPGHWDPGVYSIVHFEFKARAAATTLIFDHTGFPAGEYDHLDFGWHSHYWDPLKKYLAAQA